MKNHIRHIILGTLVLAAVGLAAVRGWSDSSGARPLTGTWKAEFDGAIGHLNYTFDIKFAGTNYTGKATRVAEAGTNITDLTEFKVDGNAVSFVEALKLNDQDLRIEYKGKISATNVNELDLARVVGEFGSNDIVAMRQLPAAVTGKWEAEFDTQMGHVKYTYSLALNGGKLTGKAIRNQDDQKTETAITNGVVSGDEVSFVEPLNFQGQDQVIEISYKGKLAGDEIKFTRSVADFATNEITAKRAK